MKQKNNCDHPYGCSVEATLSVIGGRWKPVIIFNLLQNDVLRFGELKKKIEGITQRMLTLVSAGLFHSQLRQQGRKEQGVGANFSTYTLYIDEICRYMLLVIQRNFNSSS